MPDLGVQRALLSFVAYSAVSSIHGLLRRTSSFTFSPFHVPRAAASALAAMTSPITTAELGPAQQRLTEE